MMSAGREAEGWTVERETESGKRYFFIYENPSLNKWEECKNIQNFRKLKVEHISSIAFKDGSNRCKAKFVGIDEEIWLDDEHIGMTGIKVFEAYQKHSAAEKTKPIMKTMKRRHCVVGTPRRNGYEERDIHPDEAENGEIRCDASTAGDTNDDDSLSTSEKENIVPGAHQAEERVSGTTQKRSDQQKADRDRVVSGNVLIVVADINQSTPKQVRRDEIESAGAAHANKAKNAADSRRSLFDTDSSDSDSASDDRLPSPIAPSSDNAQHRNTERVFNEPAEDSGFGMRGESEPEENRSEVYLSETDNEDDFNESNREDGQVNVTDDNRESIQNIENAVSDADSYETEYETDEEGFVNDGNGVVGPIKVKEEQDPETELNTDPNADQPGPSKGPGAKSTRGRKRNLKNDGSKAPPPKKIKIATPRTRPRLDRSVKDQNNDSSNGSTTTVEPKPIPKPRGPSKKPSPKQVKKSVQKPAPPGEYIVEKIIKHRVIADKSVEYFTRWAEHDASEDSWEPVESFNNPGWVLHEYYTRLYPECGNKHSEEKKKSK